MARWNARDGLIHFLFADEDRYILNSMVSLTLTDYLYHELRNRGFVRTAFVDGQGGSYSVRVFNEPSWRWCREQQKGLLFGLGLKPAEYAPGRDGTRIPCSAEQLRRMQKSADRSASVWSIDTFSEVYGGHEAELEEEMRGNSRRGNLLIVKSSTTAEDSLPLLTDPSGIFQASGSAGPLFPEAVSAFREEDPADEGCYVRFERLLDDRGTCLNRFSRQAVRRAVDYTVWAEGLSCPDMEELAVFIWSWYHDRKIRRRFPSLLSENLHHSYDMLCLDLRRRWPELVRAAEAMGKEPGGYGLLRAAKPQEELGVISENLLGRYLPEAPAEEYMETCDRIRQNLRKPRKNMPGADEEAMLKRFLDRMRTAMLKGDGDTVRRVEGCVADLIAGGSGSDGNTKLRWEYHEQLTGDSERLFDAEKDILRDEERRSELWAKARELHNTLRRQEGLDETGADLLKARIGSLGKQIHNFDLIIGRKKESELELQNRIVQLEQAEEMLRHQMTEESARAAGDLLSKLTDRIKEGVRRDQALRAEEVPEFDLEKLFEREDRENAAEESVPAGEPVWDGIPASEEQDGKMSDELAAFSFDEDPDGAADGKTTADRLKSILDNYY